MERTINNNNEYSATIAEWISKFTNLMMQYNNAAEAILAYYLPGSLDFMTCPLGIEEFRLIGEEMRSNIAVFTAAEDSGLIADAIPRLFYKALDNYDNWCGMYVGVEYMLTHSLFSRYIPFEYRYCANKLLAANILLLDDEDLWDECINKLNSHLRDRVLAGYCS